MALLHRSAVGRLVANPTQPKCRQNMIKIAQAQFSAEYNQLEPIRKFVEQHAVKLGFASDVVYDLIWCINEIVTNVIQHGYKEKAGTVEIFICRQGKDFIMKVRDEAPIFDPKTIPQPNLSLSLYERPLGGLGLYMTNKLVDSLSHQPTENGGNEITLVKRDIIEIKIPEEKKNGIIS